jgi:hypothetical protein
VLLYKRLLLLLLLLLLALSLPMVWFPSAAAAVVVGTPS